MALFLTVGVGFFIGRLRYRNFSLGPVTSVLIVAVLVGQLNIELSPQIKTVFFMLFLFSIGYSVGPQFFRSLRGMGLKQVLFALIMSSFCFLTTFLLAKWMMYNKGETIGMFAGSQTCSSLLAVGSDAISKLPLAEGDKKFMTDIMPVCYAVTYLFGTLGTVVILANIGPWFLGGLEKVKEETAKLEESLNTEAWKSDPVNINALRAVTFRAFSVSTAIFNDGISVEALERYLKRMGKVVYVDRVRRAGGEIEVPQPDDLLYCGDTLVVCGRREFLMENSGLIGEEVNDEELLTYPVERVPVLLTSKDVAGLSIGDLRGRREMRGVVIEEVQRGEEVPEVTAELELRKGDTLLLVGQRGNLRRVSDFIGYMEAPSNKTDIVFLGLAIFIGAFLGSLPIVIHGIPFSFGLSGGSLIGGLIFGWLRTRRPSIGYIPPSAVWLMNNLGLNVFIAVIGIDSAPTFVRGLNEVGWGLLGVGALGTTVPLVLGLLLGRYVFKFNPAITLGCCAGTRTCTASLGAVQEAIGSNIPTMAYTVTYAVSNILLVIWGVVTVALI